MADPCFPQVVPAGSSSETSCLAFDERRTPTKVTKELGIWTPRRRVWSTSPYLVHHNVLRELHHFSEPPPGACPLNDTSGSGKSRPATGRTRVPSARHGDASPVDLHALSAQAVDFRPVAARNRFCRRGSVSTLFDEADPLRCFETGEVLPFTWSMSSSLNCRSILPLLAAPQRRPRADSPKRLSGNADSDGVRGRRDGSSGCFFDLFGKDLLAAGVDHHSSRRSEATGSGRASASTVAKSPGIE